MPIHLRYLYSARNMLMQAVSRVYTADAFALPSISECNSLSERTNS